MRSSRNASRGMITYVLNCPGTVSLLGHNLCEQHRPRSRPAPASSLLLGAAPVSASTLLPDLDCDHTDSQHDTNNRPFFFAVIKSEHHGKSIHSYDGAAPAAPCLWWVMTRSKKSAETSKRSYVCNRTRLYSWAQSSFDRPRGPAQMSCFSEVVVCLHRCMLETFGPENDVVRRNTVRQRNRKMYDVSKTKLVIRSACITVAP